MEDMQAKENVAHLAEQIAVCDCSKPYYYVSYSTKDSATVYGDVVALQAQGYNLWIDVPVNFNTGEGYNTTIFNALADANCQAVLYYMSEASLTGAQNVKEVAYVTANAVQDNRDGSNMAIKVVELESVDHRDIDTWVEGALARKYGEETLNAQEAERIFKYRNKYNSKLGDINTKLDIAKNILDAVQKYADARVELETEATDRLAKTGEMLTK